MNATKFLYLLAIFLIITLASCSKNNLKREDDTYEILSIVTERKINKFPIKSLLNKNKDFNIEEFLIDNESDEFLVAIELKMSLISKDFGLRKYKQDYQTLFDELSLFDDEKPLLIDKISTSYNRVRIIEFTKEHTQKLKQRKEYRDFYLLISFYRIAFNKNNDKALLTVSSSISSLAGSYDLCFLKKENGKWKIVGF